MIVKYGNGKTKYGTGVAIELTGDEVATAIDAYLVSHNIHVNGPRTITVNGSLCENGLVYVDPSGFVITEGKKLSGSHKAVNQCDGCKLGLPIKEGIHMNYNESGMNNKFHIVCTSKTYGEE